MSPVLSATWAVFLLLAQFGQSNTGELRLAVTDASGAPLESTVELSSETSQFRENLATDARGVLVARRLPFGAYRIVVSVDGFATAVEAIEIRSAVPTERHITLTVAATTAQVTVRPDQPLIDPHQTTRVNRIGFETLQERASSLPGRALLETVNTQPGWLLEANGVLHPRGSEYQTQYILDGLPLTDNRSPAFAQDIDADVVQGMNIMTGGFPAEYGRKLGGVIEVVTTEAARQGLHGRFTASAGSFATAGGDAVAEYVGHQTSLTVAGGAAETDRYLDPPVEENLTNHGTTARAALRFERDLTSRDRVGVIVRHGQTHFLVPNELVQDAAGQRQERESRETAGQFSYQRVVSSTMVADVRGMVRDLSAGLWSNDLSTPIIAGQDRGFSEFYVKGAFSVHRGAHELKVGGDVDINKIHEQFDYRIVDPSQFDEATPATFAFSGRATGHDYSGFAQDQIRLGAWTVNAGLRWDHYSLLVDANALSPRLGVAWSWPAADMVLRASYDRAFQTPAIENILLASSPEVEVLSPDVARLPVPPSHGNFFEAGISKGLSKKARLDATYFTRQMDNFADDDLLLNTGVSFPMAFRHADIRGTEIKVDVPKWGRWSGFVSYTNMLGVGDLPITGGLLLGADASDLLASHDRFAISQDQRNTIQGRVSYRVTAPLWVAFAASYGSGLPFEFEGDESQAAEQYGQRIVDRVNFETGRVRPALSLDASVGFVILKKGERELRVQADVRNLADSLNVINFAGLFSGTVLAAPRSVAVRLQASF